MNNNISTVFNRSYKIWCCKCIVNYKWNLVCMCDFCNFFNIYYV